MKKVLFFSITLLLVLLPLSGCNRYRTAVPTPLSSPSTQLKATGQTVSAGASTAPATTMPSVTPQFPETPAPMLSAASGNIPASQNFISYSSADGHYDIQYPEGWTPAVLDGDARFTHNWDGLQVSVGPSSDPFTVDAIKSKQVADLIRKGRAVTVKNVSRVTTKSGDAVLVEYDSNSDPVDGRKVRLSCQRYYYNSNGMLAALTMWAPAGSNNANIWKQIPDTFTWR